MSDGIAKFPKRVAGRSELQNGGQHQYLLAGPCTNPFYKPLVQRLSA